MGREILFSQDTGFPLFLPDRLRFTRFLSVGLLGKRPEPKTCRWCWAPIASPRRSWCSNECVEQYLIRSSAQIVTNRLSKRDNGICAICGRDSLKIARDANWRGVWAYSSWQSDHIVPVVEGGGCCGLSNYRTLCTECHLAETAQLRKRLAVTRNPQTQITFTERSA